MASYRKDLVERYWAYQESCFPDDRLYFERPFAEDGRPPVFLKRQAWQNIISAPGASDEEKSALLSLLPERKRHGWFRSMNSSQALAQSVFGNLCIYRLLGCLTALQGDRGESLLGRAEVSSANFSMEHGVEYLEERSRTSVDVLIGSTYTVAIECKFAEREIGPCSRPLLTPRDSNYLTDYCDGRYSQQLGRMERCSLTEIGVKYWKYVPKLLTWPSDSDHSPCPLRKNYQLIRSILAACVRPDGTASPRYGHAVLIYDERNPAFHKNGKGSRAIEETQEAQRTTGLLRTCSWQRVLRHLRGNAILPWLTERIMLKYGM